MVDLRAQCNSNTYLIGPSNGNGNNPASFSSSLLDAIYRSIDLGEEGSDDAVLHNMRRKCCGADGAKVRGVFRGEDEEMANLRRARIIERWMEKNQVKSGGDLQAVKKKCYSRKDHRENSSSSSSDSSASGGCGSGGGFFSSSEAEAPFPDVRRPKPVRTGSEKERIGSGYEFNRHGYDGGETEQKPKREGGFLKTKSRALKLYGDLKKVKQPISPGGKLAGFLNSLFSGTNPKKAKSSNSPAVNTSACSSASSFSRSCLSKTPSSRGKSSAGAAKRSVRFSPVSVIVDGDSRPCEHKSLHQPNHHHHNNNNQTSNLDFPNQNTDSSIRSAIKEELMAHAMEKNRRVEEIARGLLRNYHTKNRAEFDQFEPPIHQNHDELDEEDEEEAASYASSDLFELDHLSGIGMEELPVYETTRLDTNRAIASRLIL